MPRNSRGRRADGARRPPTSRAHGATASLRPRETGHSDRGRTHGPSFSSTADNFGSSSSTVPSLTTTYVARCAFSSWVSCRAERSSSASWPRAPARGRRAAASSAHDRDRRVEARLHAGLEQQRHLHDQRAGGGGDGSTADARHDAMRAPDAAARAAPRARRGPRRWRTRAAPARRGRRRRRARRRAPNRLADRVADLVDPRTAHARPRRSRAPPPRARSSAPAPSTCRRRSRRSAR